MKKDEDSVGNHLSEITLRLDASIKLLSDNSEAEINYELWEIFADLELTVALLKLEVKKENPGIEFAKHKSTLSNEEILVKCSKIITSSISMLSRGDTEQTLEEVRDARNIMRELMARIRRR